MKKWMFLMIIVVAFIVNYSCSKRQYGAVPKKPSIDFDVNLMETSIHAIGIDQVLVTVMPPKELAGKYIVRPLCNNINLKLTCGKGENVQQVTPIQYVDRGVGIGCPKPDSGSRVEMLLYDDSYIDVVKIPDNPKDIVPLATVCNVSELFDLRPEELGITDFPGGQAVNCRIEGLYDTFGISSPELWEGGPSPRGSVDAKYEWCLNENTGKVPLKGVKQKIPEIPVVFSFPGGPQRVFPIGTVFFAKGPWMFKGTSTSAVAELDWSKATPKPKPYDPSAPPDGTDSDGFDDPREFNGFSLANGMSLTGGTYPGQTASFMTTCDSSTDSYRDYCVYYNDQEVFAILDPLSSNSRFPNMNSATLIRDFFWKIPVPKDSTNGGLDIVVHPVTQSEGNSLRTVNSSDDQMAIRVSEKSEGMDAGTVWGTSSVGVPNNAGQVDIFTVRISQYLCDMCGGDYDTAGNCSNSTTWGTSDCKSVTSAEEAWGDGLVKEYIRWVLHHEMGHSLNLTSWDLIYYNDHVPQDRDRIMTDYPDYKKKGRKVDWFLPTDYCSDCQTARKLVDSQ